MGTRMFHQPPAEEVYWHHRVMAFRSKLNPSSEGNQKTNHATVDRTTGADLTKGKLILKANDIITVINLESYRFT